ncbi:hypothetical protein [Flagellimonas onchidii]|uniref:hypothetical protein n=1 Tax=Flagellimonas onchidii TaxID=2562684 RepID=UPI0010A5C50A|nr:hypothetical protein [Allomuricauda onchidii]
MKKQALFNLLFLSIFLSLNSCTKNEGFSQSASSDITSMDEESTESSITPSDDIIATDLYDKEYIRLAELDEQLNYRSFHLAQLVSEVVSSKIDYNNSLAQESSKRNGSGKVLLRDLIYSDAFDNKGGIVDKDIQYSLGAFDGLSEEEMIPYIEKIKEGDDSSPLFLMSTYDTKAEREIVIGYQLNSNNELELVEGEILEEDIFGSTSGKSGSSSTYKIGTTDGCGNHYKSAKCGTTGTTGGTGGTTSTNVTSNNGGSQKISLRIEKMKIKDKKESWLEKADVYIAGRFMCNS